MQEAKSKYSNATDELLLLASQKSGENQVWYLGNDENNKINESLCLTSFVYVYFYCKVFYHCNEDHCGMCEIFGILLSLVCYIIYYKSFYHCNEDHNQKI